MARWGSCSGLVWRDLSSGWKHFFSDLGSWRAPYKQTGARECIYFFPFPPSYVFPSSFSLALLFPVIPSLWCFLCVSFSALPALSPNRLLSFISLCSQELIWMFSLTLCTGEWRLWKALWAYMCLGVQAELSVTLFLKICHIILSPFASFHGCVPVAGANPVWHSVHVYDGNCWSSSGNVGLSSLMLQPADFTQAG